MQSGFMSTFLTTSPPNLTRVQLVLLLHNQFPFSDGKNRKQLPINEDEGIQEVNASLATANEISVGSAVLLSQLDGIFTQKK